MNQPQSIDYPNKRETKQTVCLLTFEFPPNLYGGLGTHVAQLSKALVEQGMEVHVITYSLTGYREQVVEHGIHIHRLDVENHDDFYLFIANVNREMVEYVIHLSSQLELNVIHGHDWLVGTASMVLKKILKTSLVVTIHALEYGRNGGISTPLQQKIMMVEKKMSYEADRLIVCSEYMKQEVKTILCVESSQIEVIENGVEIKQKSLHSQHLLVFALGRFVGEKGFQTLIKSAAIVKKEVHGVQFVLAGHGPMQSELEKLCQFYDVADCFTIIGFLTDTEKRKWFERSSVVVVPSYYEPFGIVALEAMSHGRPLIGTETGGLSEIIDGYNGIKVPPKDENALATHLITLLQDSNKACELGNQGYEYVKKYNWTTVAQKTLDLYKTI
ncbi:glycosyltransferase family 4 protein [Bacillus alkalicellulosilyticus]|uniref:glycosyltransferase family 4 protein n=1 Tax=Alkalihalobacterium alkalicellulosilyticum TaxID=1912214 RepID=UPI0009983AF2|nr:glycosyltransferase family 4 protein [Bacillus alkalicellulosilyticus]